MTSIIVTCPAKINTFLAVGAKDAASYHPIRTIFQTISLCDRLTVTPSDETRVTSNWDALPAENTVAKALRLLAEFGDVPPLSVHIEKSIPTESGLGGGSSDAAGVLRAINQLASHPFRRDVLCEVAAAVGADVPFFLVGGRAKGEGYGEQITPLEDVPTKWLVIAKPDVSCSTKAAYTALDERDFPFREFPNDLDELYNDFERVMPCECDDWSEHLMLLGAAKAQLTGSGSAMFGAFADESAAQHAKQDLDQRPGIRSWVARTLSRAESLSIEKN
jgi:4-diphosphocytidyl-2-C-methyl-D-erythritol kinase